MKYKFLILVPIVVLTTVVGTVHLSRVKRRPQDVFFPGPIDRPNNNGGFNNGFFNPFFNPNNNNNNNNQIGNGNTPTMTTTTQAPVGSTTLSPTLIRCVANCPSTNQYNPVCGTDEQTYHNRARLDCYTNCGTRE